MDIEVNSGGIQGTASSFQAQVATLESQFDEIMSKTQAVKAGWEGDDSDAVLSQIQKFEQLFEAVRAKNQTYISFMNQTAQNYSTEDDITSAAASNLDT